LDERRDAEKLATMASEQRIEFAPERGTHDERANGSQ
jgi:hypothetical protein